MPKFKLNAVTSKPEDFAALKEDITSLLSNPNNYIINFYYNEPPKEVTENEDNIIINAEYGAVAHILKNIVQDNPNIRYGSFDKEKMLRIRWLVISEDTSQQTKQ